MRFRRAASLVLLLLASVAHAAAPQQTLTIGLGDTQTLEMLGVTAAWAVDANVAGVTSQQSRVTISGRGPGRTTVIVVSVTGQHSYDVVVQPRVRAAQAATRNDHATAEARYSSAARELQSSVMVSRIDKDKRTEAAVRTIHHAGTPQGDRAKTSIAGATYRVFTPGREVTFFDRDVDHSPLTLQATPLRGLHYLDDHWRLHAGYTAYAAYRSFLVPVERQLVAGGGYAIRTGKRSVLTPSVFAIRGEGAIASLLYDYTEGDRLFVRGELAYSHGIGGAAEVAFDDANDRVRAAVRYRPDDFAVAGTATLRGFLGDASWTHTYGRGSTASTSWSATDTNGLRVITGAADVDHRLTDRVYLTGGANWASFDGRNTLTIPAGVRLDFERAGISALYRYTRAFNNEGGHGFRVAGRVSLGHFHASAFADQQRNAPTLDLIFSERPDLALALTELGIVATSPADVARALREEAVLRQLGFIDGITIDLAPVRTQVGFDAAWIGTSDSRQQLRARLLRSVTESVAARTTTLIATLAYSRRLTAASDVFASWSYWRTDTAIGEARVEPFFELGVRQRFDRLPAFVGGLGTISGVVFLDENLDGKSDGKGVAAEVELDGSRRERTRDDGSFAFNSVPRGTHRVTARVPGKPDAYFTTASRVEAEPGDRLAFGVATTAARLFGRIVDDAGNGIAGVRLQLTRGANQLTGESATDGRFTFGAAPGEWQLSIERDSVPAGYSLAHAEPRAVMLSTAQPLNVDIKLPAHRTIRGRAARGAEIIVQPLNRRVKADAEGNFAIRSLPPGAVTLTANGVEQRVDVPHGPATVDVNFTVAVAETRTEVTGERVARMGEYVVQIGAYRVHANAVAAAERARAAGVQVELAASGTLTLVRTAPQTQGNASAIAGRLTRAGIEAVVVASRSYD